MRPSVDGSRSTIHAPGSPSPSRRRTRAPRCSSVQSPSASSSTPGGTPEGRGPSHGSSSDSARSSSTVHHPRPTSTQRSRSAARGRRLLAVGHRLQHEAAGGARVVTRSLADPRPDLQLGGCPGPGAVRRAPGRRAGSRRTSRCASSPATAAGSFACQVSRAQSVIRAACPATRPRTRTPGARTAAGRARCPRRRRGTCGPTSRPPATAIACRVASPARPRPRNASRVPIDER